VTQIVPTDFLANSGVRNKDGWKMENTNRNKKYGTLII